MKKLANKILVAVMACMLAVTAIAPMKVEAATVTKSQTVYRSGKGSNSYAEIYIGGLKATSKITNIKSNKTSIAKPYSVTYYSDEYEYFEEGNTNSNEYYAYLKVKLMKKGTAKISFKVDGKKKTSTIKVLDYTNPVKTATLTGTMNGKKTTIQMASATKDRNVVFYSHSKPIKNAQATFASKNGWVITNINVYNDGEGVHNTFRNNNGLKKTIVNLGTMSNKEATVIYVTYMNKKTKGTIQCMYLFNA